MCLPGDFSLGVCQPLKGGLTQKPSPTLTEGDHSTLELPEHENGGGFDGL